MTKISAKMSSSPPKSFNLCHFCSKWHHFPSSGAFLIFFYFPTYVKNIGKIFIIQLIKLLWPNSYKNIFMTPCLSILWNRFIKVYIWENLKLLYRKYVHDATPVYSLFPTHLNSGIDLNKSPLHDGYIPVIFNFVKKVMLRTIKAYIIL